MHHILSLICLLLVTTTAFGQTTTLWGGLEAGSHTVGFRLVQTYDQTRTYLPKNRPDGKLTQGVRARPMHLGLWYPASPASGAMPMSFATYRFSTLPKLSHGVRTHSDSLQIEAIFRARLAAFAQAPISDAAFTRFMQRPTAVYRNAPPVESLFPLIVLGNGLEHEMLLAEYLASHGYVVVSPAVLDPGLAQEPTTWQQYHQAVQDLNFAMAYARQLPFVEANQTGTLGFGGGGIYTYLLAMQSPEIDAVVSLESALFMEPWLSILDQIPYYAPDRFDAALLHVMRRSESERAENLDAYDALRHADRYRLLLETPGVQHGDIGSYWLALVDGLAYQPDGYETIAVTNHTLLEHIWQFFDGTLKEEVTPRRSSFVFAESLASDSLLTLIHDPGREASPPLMQWVALFKQEGFAGMQDAFLRYQQAHSGAYTPSDFDQTGTHFLRTQQLPEAVAVYRLFERTFPQSAQAAYRLAMSLERLGALQDARTAYQACLARLANDDAFDEAGRTRLRQRTQRALQRLSN